MDINITALANETVAQVTGNATNGETIFSAVLAGTSGAPYTLSNGGKTASRTGGGVWTHIPVTTFRANANGKFYWEMTIDDHNGEVWMSGMYQNGDNTDTYIGNTPESWGVRNGGQVFNDSLLAATDAPSTTNNDDVYCWRVDYGPNKLECRINNGTWYEMPTIISGTDYRPAFGNQGVGTNECTIATVDSQFQYTVPTGYVAWDSGAFIRQEEDISIVPDINTGLAPIAAQSVDAFIVGYNSPSQLRDVTVASVLATPQLEGTIKDELTMTGIQFANKDISTSIIS